MKTKVIVLITCSVLVLQLTGCATMEKIGWREKGAVIGAASGAIIGGILKDGRGALIGTFAGAILGGVLGNHYDKQIKVREEAVEKHAYEGKEEKIEIEDSIIRPNEVATGSKTEAIVLYTILLPDEKATAKITEIRTLVSGEESLELTKREIVRAQGTHLSTMRFTIPADLTQGDYVLMTTISDTKQTVTTKNSLKIL